MASLKEPIRTNQHLIEDAIMNQPFSIPKGPVKDNENNLIDLAKSFGERFGETAAARDRERLLPHAEIRQLAESGLLAARVPRAYGGHEISIAAFSEIVFHLAKGDPNIAQAACPIFPNIEKIRIYGSEDQKRHYFSLALQGRLLTGNAAAERSGHRIGDMSTKVEKGTEGYRLNGVKSYSTGSLFAEYVLVTAHLGEASRAAVMVPTDRKGVGIIDDWDGMGQRLTASGTAVFEDVSVEKSEILEIPTFGQRRTYEGSFAQILHSAIDTGIAFAAIDDALLYGRTMARVLPESGVDTAGGDPYVLHTVGEMVIQANAARLLLQRAAEMVDQGVNAFYQLSPQADRLLAEASIAVAEAKFASSEASIRVSEMIYRIGGASATSTRLNLDRHWRNARTHTTHDPVAYKARAIGDFYLNGKFPPINTKI